MRLVLTSVIALAMLSTFAPATAGGSECDAYDGPHDYVRDRSPIGLIFFTEYCGASERETVSYGSAGSSVSVTSHREGDESRDEVRVRLWPGVRFSQEWSSESCERELGYWDGDDPDAGAVPCPHAPPLLFASWSELPEEAQGARELLP